MPVERSRSCRTRAPRHGCQPCLRESRPRAASRRHNPRVRVALVGDTPLVEGSPADGSLSRAGDECGVYVCVRSDDGTTTALLPNRARRGLLPFREEQEVPPPSPGLGSDGWTAAPSGLAGESLRGSRAESQPHAPRACTPPGQGEKILSARRAGQAGGLAGSGKTIPSGRSPPDPPSERPTPYPGSEHGWFTGQSGDPLGGGPSHDCPVGPGMAVASHSGAE